MFHIINPPLQGDLAFEMGQGGAEAVVDAAGEGQVLGPGVAGDVHVATTGAIRPWAISAHAANTSELSDATTHSSGRSAVIDPNDESLG